MDEGDWRDLGGRRWRGMRWYRGMRLEGGGWRALWGTGVAVRLEIGVLISYIAVNLVGEAIDDQFQPTMGAIAAVSVA